MTSIVNLLSNYTNSTKTINEHAREYKENKKNKKSLNESTPAITQGEKFKHYQKKIKKNLEKQTQNFKYFNEEGFRNIENNLHLTADGLTAQTNNVIQSNIYASQQSTIDNLRQQYQATLTEYENLVAKISGNTSGYLDRVSPNNPYLGKNIVFTTGESAYVTLQGVVKLYKGFSATAAFGKNGCPTGIETPINLPWLPAYNTPGATIPSKPPLITGTPITKAQSCGNEGKNVFVNKMINNPTVTFNSCSADNPTSPLMTFIGGAPPPPSASLQNGNFEQPQIANNSYQYISSLSQVPGWNFFAVLINNSAAWGYPMPYPKGSQAACIQATQIFGQWIQMSSGTYTLTFYACGRPGYLGANTINVYCGQNPAGGTSEPTIYTFTPPTTAWQKYTTTFNLSNTGNTAIGFYGTSNTGDRSAAIQGIQINRSSGGSSGSYTYDQCKQVAIDAGYQYFALQGVNTSTSKGYCAVSNDQPRITSLGAALVPSGMNAVWSSNTSVQTGNTATLTNQGALSVINSGGQSVFSTPNSSAQPSNYLGCYGDGPNRALPIYNNGSQQYNLQSCQQIAKQNNATYFGLQDSTSGQNAQCTFGNDFSQATKYGPAGNCTKISDGSWSGGGWSNAVYNTSLPQSNYVLVLGDYYLQIQRGTTPNDNQGIIWQGINFSKGDINPNYTAAMGKYGKNWISQGSTLAAGDFIGSPSGYAALVMQTDGNLVLYTFSMVSNCQKMNDGNTGGGVNANAIYNIGEVGNQSNLSKLAYIDQNAELHMYPSTNTKYGNSYTEFQGNDSAGNDIPGAAYGNATVDSCKATCNANQECAGFAFSNTNVCFPKTSGMYPNGAKTINSTVDLYTRNKSPISTPIGVPNSVNNIDTITYGNYVNGGELSNSYGLANANAAQKAQLEQLQSQLNLLTNQLSSYTDKFGQGSQDAALQSQTNVIGLTDYVDGLKNTTDKISGIVGDGNINNILKDSDIVVLQKNYDYLFWSILATGSVLVAMNTVKK